MHRNCLWWCICVVFITACTAQNSSPVAINAPVSSPVATALPPLPGLTPTFIPSPSDDTRGLPLPSTLIFDPDAASLISVPSMRRLLLRVPASYPIVAPNGTAIAYLSSDQLLVTQLATGAQVLLAPTHSAFVFTPDSQSLLYTVMDGAQWQLRHFDLRTQTVRVLFTFAIPVPPRDLRIAPLGDAVVATTQDIQGVHVWTLDLQHAAVTDLYSSSQPQDSVEAWIPQGIIVAQVHPQDSYRQSTQNTLLLIHPTTQLSQTLAEGAMPDIAPDARHIVLSNTASTLGGVPPQATVFVLDTGTMTMTSDLMDETTSPGGGEIGRIRWAPDSTHFLVVYNYGYRSPGYEAVFSTDVQGRTKNVLRFGEHLKDEVVLDAVWQDAGTILLLTAPEAGPVTLSRIARTAFSASARQPVVQLAVSLDSHILYVPQLNR